MSRIFLIQTDGPAGPCVAFATRAWPTPAQLRQAAGVEGGMAGPWVEGPYTTEGQLAGLCAQDGSWRVWVEATSLE